MGVVPRARPAAGWFWLGLALLALGALPAARLAQALPAVPPAARVTDLTATLAPAQVAALDARLADYEARRGVQVAVLVVASTAPEGIEAYALRVAMDWQLGRKGIDDGALLVIALDDRQLRIEVGYGLEGVLTDAVSRRIIDEDIVPRLRAGDLAGGIDAGVARMLAVIDGEALPAPAARRDGTPGAGLMQVLPVLLVFVLTLGAALKRGLGQLPGAAVTAGLAGGLAWLIAASVAVALLAALATFVLTLASRAGPGRWSGGGRGGRIGGGSFGGGGFRGGGGSFGGGGASGRW
jgi:uncharacterized protein